MPGSEEERVEAKLSVSQPGDPLEQEADRFAEQVMRGGAPVEFREAAPAVQRQPEKDTGPAEEEADDVMPEELATGMLFPQGAAPALSESCSGLLALKIISRGHGPIRATRRAP
jgi:hypothetical protein